MKFVLLLILITGCGVSTSGNININVDDIKIVRKGDLCFGLIASKKAGELSSSGLGLTYIPCEKIGD